VPALTVALLQMVPHSNDQQANLQKGEDFCLRARAMGADIALFPEMWNIGYTPYEGCPDDFHEQGNETPEQIANQRQWQKQAIPRDGSYVKRFQQLAHQSDMAIALTYLESWPGAPRNTVSLIDRYGNIALTYAKIHTCDFGMECALTPGDEFEATTIDTAQGLVKIGMMICYDREFPESARILMLKGAEIILTPNACEMEANRLGQFRARAYENLVGVALANYAAPTQNGHSAAYSPIAFRKGHTNDTLIIEAGEAEGIYLATFDLDALRDYRQKETWGNAFRRPHRYTPLISPEVNEPFIRRNARGERYDGAQR
jgi:N-carbamoylputrescine amidase